MDVNSNDNTLNKESIVVGCNYHTTWQSDKAMRFVLLEVKEDKAKLGTRRTKKVFWTNLSDLIFIMTEHNIEKAKKLLSFKNKSIEEKLSEYI